MFIGRSYGGSSARSWPSSAIVPEVGVSKPASMRSRVVLPEPDEPSRAKTSPLAMSIETLSTARWPSKSLTMVLIRRKASALIGTSRRLDAALQRRARKRGKSERVVRTAVFSTSAMVLIAWSMCDSSTISGGDRAMMSPVVRIRTPRSKHSRKTSKARLPGLPAIDSSSIAADQADVADVDHVRRFAQRVDGVLERRRDLARRA